MPRPRLPDGKAKTAKVLVSYQPEFLRALDAKARERGLTRQQAIREASANWLSGGPTEVVALPKGRRRPVRTVTAIEDVPAPAPVPNRTPGLPDVPTGPVVQAHRCRRVRAGSEMINGREVVHWHCGECGRDLGST